ncbi:siderophore-interacting protein [soil metagenome]
MPTTTTALPLLIEKVEVVALDRLSPSFVRVELGSPALAELGVQARSYDQRIKLIFAEDGHPLPSFAGAGEGWYGEWVARPPHERGHMRTYTVRAVRGSGAQTRLVVDIVVHEGATGPAGRWAETAAVGDRVVVTAPRKGHVGGGIEFAPGDDDTLLLVGDETAVPAIAAILEQLDPDVRGDVFLEVPVGADVLTLQHPAGISVRWLPREGAARGVALHAAVLEQLDVHVAEPAVADDEVDPDLWETPLYSSSGEDAEATSRAVGHEWHGLYAWIAGEAKVVTGLRRALVKDLGMDRHQVAFMGYWREGRAS